MNKHLCSQCDHPFSHPLVLTNKSGETSETYYACPYCLSRIDADENDVVLAFREERKTTGFIDNPPKSPESNPGENLECSEAVWKNIVIPDECLDCANLLPCVHTLITLMESRRGSLEKRSPGCKFL